MTQEHSETNERQTSIDPEQNTQESFEPYSETKPSLMHKMKVLFAGNGKGMNLIKHPKTILMVVGVIVVVQIAYGLYVSQNVSQFDINERAQIAYAKTEFKGQNGIDTMINLGKKLNRETQFVNNS